MLRCSFFILSAARSRALRTVVPLPSPTVVPFLSSRTACAAALSLAFSIQLILVRLPFCLYLFESFHGFEDFFSDALDLLLSLVPRLLPWVFFRLVDLAFRFRLVYLRERVSYDISLEVGDSEFVSCFRDISFGYGLPNRVWYWERL